MIFRRDTSRERYVMLCDPQIVRAFRNPWHYSVDIWKYWMAIEAPILVIRGADSDLLPADLAGETVRRNSRAKVHTIEGCGHAPPLMNLEADQVRCKFLTFLGAGTFGIEDHPALLRGGNRVFLRDGCKY
jgi:pimeloyl-ACP methyl ester carboxylesterase